MPKKKQALPTPKAKLYTEDAALLVPIFQKEPFITFQELQDKYGDILTDQQICRPSRPRCSWRSFPTQSAAV